MFNVRHLLRRVLTERLIAFTIENPRERLIKTLVVRGEIPESWGNMLNSPGVISNDVHVPEFDPNTSNDEYELLKRLEITVETLFQRLVQIGGYHEGSRYLQLAQFIRAAGRMLTGARQEYEQIRFGGGETRMSTRTEDMEEAAEQALLPNDDDT